MYGNLKRDRSCRSSIGSRTSGGPQFAASSSYDPLSFMERSARASISSFFWREAPASGSAEARGFLVAANQEVKMVLDLLQDLLAAHEVKISIELLRALSKSGLADCSFSETATTLCDEMQVFMETVKDRTISDSTTTLLTLEQLIQQLRPRQEPSMGGRRKEDGEVREQRSVDTCYVCSMDREKGPGEKIASHSREAVSEDDLLAISDENIVSELSIVPMSPSNVVTSVSMLLEEQQEAHLLPGSAPDPPPRPAPKAPRPSTDDAIVPAPRMAESMTSEITAVVRSLSQASNSKSLPAVKPNPSPLQRGLSKGSQLQGLLSQDTRRSLESEASKGASTPRMTVLSENASQQSPKRWWRHGTATSHYDDDEMHFERDNSCNRVNSKIDFDDLSMEQMQFLATPSDSWVIHPDHRLRLSWDGLTLFLIIFECITLPISLCFDVPMPFAVHVTSTVIFCFDILLQFNTGYNEGSTLIMRRAWVTRHYLRTWFLFDIIATFPWEELFSSEEQALGQEQSMFRIAKIGKLARVMRLLRLAKIMVLVKRLQLGQYFFVKGNAYHVRLAVVIIKMLVVFGFLAHWFACIWGALGYSYSIGVHDLADCANSASCEPGLIGSPWIYRYGLNRYDTWTIYTVAVQFTTSILTGGNTPLQPGAPGEMLFTVFVMICSLLVTSSVVGQILLIMNRHAEQSMAFDDMMQGAREFMMSRKVPGTLQTRVQRYLETQNKTALGNGDQQAFWIQQLSDWLQTELNIALTRGHIFSHPFFQELEVIPDALRRVCLDATSSVYAAGDLLVEEGRSADCVHFLVRGKIRIVKVGICKYEVPPCWIGDVCLFQETTRSATVSCVISSETIIVHKSRFNRLCDENLRVAELRDLWRDKLESEGLNSFRCPACGQIGHAEKNCPMLTHTQDQEGGRKGRGSIRSVRSAISNAKRTISKWTNPGDTQGDNIDADTICMRASFSKKSRSSRHFSFMSSGSGPTSAKGHSPLKLASGQQSPNNTSNRSLVGRSRSNISNRRSVESADLGQLPGVGDRSNGVADSSDAVD